MAAEIKMPKMGLTMSLGTVGKWLKKENEQVKKGEEILEVTTEKLTNTVEASADGILLKILIPEGEEVPIGTVLGLIGEPGEKVESQETGGGHPAKCAEEEKIKITPSARKFAQEQKFNYAQIAGTGPGGRITREDVEKAIAKITSAPEEETVFPEKDVLELIPYVGMRKAIGDNMSRSWNTAPQVTHHVSADVSKILALRKTVNEDRDEKEKISLTDLLVKIIAKALELKPNINVTLDGSQIKVLKNINIGVAVALDKGLVVPVINDANQKTLAQISREIKDLAGKARENRLSMENMSGGTFTISNLGAYGSVDWFTPIINQPESAILGVGRIADRPVICDGQVVSRPFMGLSLSFDHRVIDGAPAAEFLTVLLQLLEKPSKVLI